jgi:hypothetical protein
MCFNTIYTRICPYNASEQGMIWKPKPYCKIQYSMRVFSKRIYTVYTYFILLCNEYCINGQANEYVRTIIMSGTIFKITFLQVPSFMIILSFTSYVKAKISFLKINLSEILKLHLFRSSDAKFLAIIQFACIMARINFMLLVLEPIAVYSIYSIYIIMFYYSEIDPWSPKE